MKLGRVPIEVDEPVYHAAWEGRLIGINSASQIAGAFNLDEFRSGIEQMHPVAYMAASYYERWLYSIERNLVKHGVLTADELEQRLQEVVDDPDRPLPARDDPAFLRTIEEMLRGYASSRRAGERPPRFGVGDRVRARPVRADPHTRNPEYVHGKAGVVHRVHDAYPLPDEVVRGAPETADYVYTVRFDASELWPDADARTRVLVDLWESYLEPVAGGAA
jgi:nitrile hydratase beta subunit